MCQKWQNNKYISYRDRMPIFITQIYFNIPDWFLTFTFRQEDIYNKKREREKKKKKIQNKALSVSAWTWHSHSEDKLTKPGGILRYCWGALGSW